MYFGLTEGREFIPEYCAESNQVVTDWAEDCWGQDRRRELRINLGPEVRAHGIHVVVGFSQEHRSFVWENQDDVLNSVEWHAHGDEEEGSVSILDSRCISLDVVEKNNAEEWRHHGNQELDPGSLGQTDHIQEVPLSQELELVAPRRLLLELVITYLKRLSREISFSRVILQMAVLVRVREEFDTLGIDLLDIPLTLLQLISIIWVRLFNTLDTHNAHEIVSRIAEVWAFVVDGGEVVDSHARLVEVDHFTFGQQHQPVEHLEDVGVWLVDRLDDCPALLRQVFQRFHHTCGCEWIQAGCRLIKEDQGWVCDQLDTDWSSLPLTAWDTFY